MPARKFSLPDYHERLRAEVAFLKGELSLWDAIVICIDSKMLQERVLFAYADYQNGKHDDLAGAFGVALTTKQKGELRRLNRDQFIRGLVDEAATGERVWLKMPNSEKGQHVTLKKKPKTEDVKGSAFDHAAKYVGLSGSRVKKIYQAKTRGVTKKK